jgi:hypothetical protein
LFFCEDFGGGGTLQLAAPRMAHGSLGSLLQKERLLGAPLCSALFSGADSFLGASVGRFYAPTAKGWRCLGPFDRAPMRPNIFRVVHDREAHQEKSEKLCVSLRPQRLCGVFFFFRLRPNGCIVSLRLRGERSKSVCRPSRGFRRARTASRSAAARSGPGPRPPLRPAPRAANTFRRLSGRLPATRR